jgi:hypothetical protein
MQFDPRVHKYWGPMGPWPANRPVFPTQPGQPTFGPGVPQGMPQGMPQQMRPSFPPQGMPQLPQPPQGMPFGGPQGMPFGGPQMPQQSRGVPQGMPFGGQMPQMPVQPQDVEPMSRLRSVLGF